MPLFTQVLEDVAFSEVRSQNPAYPRPHGGTGLVISLPEYLQCRSERRARAPTERVTTLA
jgi:hypothetical protein